MARGQRKLEVVISGDSRQLERAFGRSARASESFGHRLAKGAGKGLLLFGGGVATAAVAGVAGLGFGLVKAGRAAADAEASNARLSAQLKTLGKNNAAVKGNIDATVQSLSMMSGFDDEDLQDAFTGLVRSSGNVAKSQRDLGIAADIAASGTMNLTGASKLINRVNAGNVGSLKKLGIEVDKNTTKEEALAKLRAKFAGQAEAFGKTSSGAQARLGVALENTFEQVGVALLPVTVELANLATKYLPGVAKAISGYLGQAISWLKANWPQIKSVIVSVFTALKTYYTTIVIPVAQGIITAFGAMIGFVREHMPEIRAAAQAVFGWIKTNIVPTVRTVAASVSTIVRGMATVWREHGNDIKAVLTPLFNTIRTLILGALKIIRSGVEFYLAVIRGDWGKAFGALKTIVSTAFDMVKSVLLLQFRTIKAIAGIAAREVVEWISAQFAALKAKIREKLDAAKTAITEAKDGFVQTAKSLGADLVRGIAEGITSLPGLIKDKLTGLVTGAFDAAKKKAGINSPSRVAAQEIGSPIARGVAAGIAQDSKTVASALSRTVREAVQSARGNLGSLTGGLAGMLGDLFGSSSVEGKRLREIRAQQKKEQAEREKTRLLDAIGAAETAEEKKQAEQDYADWKLEQEAAGLEETIQNQRDSYETNIRNLTSSFNEGLISATEFKNQLNALIGGQTGAELGQAFATEFAAQLSAITQQIANLAGAPAGAGGPGVESPGEVSAQELQDWKQARAARLEELKKPFKLKKSDGGTAITKAEWDKINAGLDKWDANHPKPKALAMGGVLRRAVLAGEAGPEAVLPLSSGRAQKMLAGALDGADRIRGGGSTTVVNVTVSGNEFSARDFAKKLQPELNRLVGFGQV